MKALNFLVIFLSAAIFLSINISNLCYAKVISGNINQEDILEKSHTVVDGATGNPVSGAEVSIPNEGFFTRTNDSGQFKLDTSFKSPAVLSVQANGYSPFSVTIDENKSKNPLIIVVTKLFGNETVIDSELHHLGDDNYSKNSANAEDFKLKAEGADFSKKFFVGKFNANTTPVLKIGTIIGLDTKLAHMLDGKTRIKASSTPMQVYINSKKIGEIKINGDRQEISLPGNILRPNAYNMIRIETGVNEEALGYVDYDDMEFMNLILDVK